MTLLSSTLPPLGHGLPLSHHDNNLFLDSSLCVHFLTSISPRGDLKLTTSLHAATMKTGIHSNLFVANSLLDLYSKCGRPDHAYNLFDRMPDRDVVSWTSVISGHCRSGAADVALSLFSEMLSQELAPPPNDFTLAALLQACGILRDDRMGQVLHGFLIKGGFFEDIFLSNSLIDLYSKLGLVMSAEKMIDGMPHRDVVAWSALISGCVLHGMMEKALDVFVMMLEDGIAPNLVTMLSIIRACSFLMVSQPCDFGDLHALAIKLGLHIDAFIVNALIQMYCKNSFFEEGLKVLIFSYLLNGDWCFEPEVMVALIQGCTQSMSLEQGRGIHGLLIKYGFFPCLIVENSLMDMYAKLERVDLTRQIFEKMEIRDIVSWNTLLSCLAKSVCASETLSYLTELHCQGLDELVPDFVTILSSIHACSGIASLQQGCILHCYAIKSGIFCDVFISNALIDMYAKSGRIDSAKKIFETMHAKDLGSWNSMIAAYGIHGDGNSALVVFQEMKRVGKQKPNAITFSSIISACSHSGLTKDGHECFESMHGDYGIEPTMEHYASMVDLLGRSGKIIEAEDFIERMPINPSPDVWGSLLGACGLYGNVDIAERAAKRLAVLEPDNNIWRVALSKIYAFAGRWEDAANVRANMKRDRFKKEAGWSAVEIQGVKMFRFMAGDARHPEREKIYEACNSLMEQILDVPLEAY